MNVLVACEESQAVTIQLRSLGHTAFSCDLQECSGGFPEFHIKGSCIELLNGHTSFKTCDGMNHMILTTWDLIIAHPPCTYLSYAGNKYLSPKFCSSDKISNRLALRSLAADFFLEIYNADCPHIAIENPVGYMNSYFRKPDQIIYPYYFGDPYSKRTCLWLKNLPLLVPDYVSPKPEPVYIQPNGKRRHFVEACHSSNRQKLRSKTFPGIARAMAYQWTNNFFVLA